MKAVANRKRKFDLKESLIKLIRSITKNQVYFVLTPILFFFVNSYLMQNLIANSNGATLSVSSLINFLGLLYGISLFVLAYIISELEINIWFVLKLLVSYLVYNAFTYLVAVHLNINNPEFKLWDSKSETLIQLESLPTLLFIFILAFTIFGFKRYYDKKANRKTEAKLSKKFEYFLLGQVLVTFLLTDSKIPIFLRRTGWYIFDELGKYDLGRYTIKQFWFIEHWLLIFSILLAVLGYLFVKGQADMVKNYSSFSLAFFSSVVFAIIFNFTIQLGLGNESMYLGYSLFPAAVIFQFLMLFFLFMMIYLILNNFWIGSLIISVAGISFSVANSIKFSMRGEPILPSDLEWLKSPFTLLGFIDINQIVLGLAVLILLMVVFLTLKRYLYRGRIVKYKPLQAFFLIGSIWIYSYVYGVFNHQENGKVAENIPIISVLNNFQETQWLGNTINTRYRSLSYVWMSQLTTDVMEEPKGYSPKKIKELERKYQNLAEEMNKDRTGLLQDQTVIYVLSESFADPARVDGVSLSQNPIPKIQNIKNQDTSGLMKSDGYGGGTANMEFQTLTGLPFYNINPTVSVLYSEVAPKMNRLPSISDAYASKNKEIIHYESKVNYSRDVIYNRLNFDKFISIDDVKKYKANYREIHISDASTYDTVLQEMKPNQGQFFSVITMQNHAPFIAGEPQQVTAQGAGLSEDENEKLTNYSRLLSLTDDSTQEFLESLDRMDKKITVVFYGDHLPGLYPSKVFKDNPESQYLTDYFIWSNYETPKRDYPLVNSSDFSALVLEETNSKVSPYYALLTEVLHKASVDKKELDAEGQEIAEDLKMIEYDMINGRGYLSQDFFKLPAK